MTNIIFAMYSESLGFGGVAKDPEKAFRTAMDRLAQTYKEYGSRADFGIVDSAEIRDICFSSQCFFPKDLEEALQRQGIYDVRVHGLVGGSYDTILENIKEFDPDIKCLNGLECARDLILYRFEGENKNG